MQNEGPDEKLPHIYIAVQDLPSAQDRPPTWCFCSILKGRKKIKKGKRGKQLWTTPLNKCNIFNFMTK